MQKENKNLYKNDIDLEELSRLLWKDKFIILTSVILFSALAYLYTLKLDISKEFKSEISIKNPPESIFQNYKSFFNKTKYSREFNFNLNSLDSLQRFVEQNDKIPEFKKFLQNKNISPKQYFRSKFGKIPAVEGQLVNNRYFLIYHESLDGNIFLDEYISFIKNDTISNIKLETVNLIEKQIAEHTYNLEIAKKINLKNSLIQKMSDREVNAFLFYTPSETYYRGSIILELEISKFKKTLKQIEIDNFDFNPILDEAIVVAAYTKNYKKYPLAGFLVGLLLSFIIIFLKKIIIKK